VPVLAGSVLELPMGMLAGHGRRRHRVVLGGGLAFILALAGAALARTLPELLFAFIAFYPASGAFVSLTQAELMDAFPDRRAQHMARWDLAGSAGAAAGPLVVAAVLASGGGWRGAYLVLAGLSAVAWLGMCRRGAATSAGADRGEADPAGTGSDGAGSDGAGSDGAGSDGAGSDGADPGGAGSDGADLEGADPDGADPGEPGPAGPAGRRPWAARAREVIAAVRGGGTLRWLVLLEVADLLLDVLTGFVALYLVDVAHATPAVAAVGMTVRLAAGLAGDAGCVFVLERAGDLAVLRATAVAAALLYPGFLLVPGLLPKLAALAALTAATSPWYPVLQARLYGSLPGRSPVAVTLSSAAAMAGGLGPLAVGLIAQAAGLPWALACLTVVPLVILAVSR